MRIREYTDADKDNVIALISDCLESIFNAPPGNIEDLHDIKKYYGSGAFFVAEEKGDLIGVCGLDIIDNKARLRRLYVKGSFRGLGIGKNLAEKAIGICMKKGIKTINASTYERMESKGFYNRLGFKETHREGERIFLRKEIR